MALAETARLAVQLDLAGNFNAGMTQAEGKLAAFDAAAAGSSGRAGMVSGAFTRIGGAARGAGGALNHAGGQIKGLLTGPLGLLGLTGGLLTLGGALKAGITRAIDFGGEVRQMAAVTGLSAETVSSLAAAMEHFGVGADKAIRLTGFLEKNVGLLAAKKDGLAKFQQTFGLALTDTNGKLKDANELILTTADYFTNKSIPATQKAAALSKLYGRSWQDLVPFLKAGRKGIQDAEEEARRLGLTLTKDNVSALAKLKTVTREWGTALGGLELQIGLTLIPTLTKLASAATKFVSDHRTDIVAFFRNAAEAGEKIAGTIGDVIGGLSAAWTAIPAPLRDFIVKGVVADRTIKFLFGFSPIGALASGIEHALGKAVAGGLVQAGLGKLFVQPVFVTNPGFGGGGNPLNPTNVAKGTGLGLPSLATLGSFGAALAIGFIPVAAAGLTLALVDNDAARARALQGRQDTATARGGDGSRIGPMTGPPGTQPVNRRPATGGLSPEDRQILSNQWKTSLRISDRTERVRQAVSAGAVRISAVQALMGHRVEKANAHTAERTEALRTALTRPLANANAKLQKIADKRESTNVSTVVRLLNTTNVSVNGSGVSSIVDRRVSVSTSRSGQRWNS